MHSAGHRGFLRQTVPEYHEDILNYHAGLGRGYQRLLIVLGVFFVLGVGAFVVRLLGDGLDDRQPWGYYAATVGFLLTTAGTAPLAVIGLRAVRAHWRRPLARISETYGVVSILIVLMYIPLLFLLPGALNRKTFYFQGDELGTLGRIPGAPHVYDSLLFVAMLIGALGLLWASSRADRAVLMDQAGASPGGWRGSRKQWTVQKIGGGLLGGIYFVTIIGGISMFSLDFALSFVPGWKDAIFPAFQSLTGLQGGLATVIVTLYLARRFGGLEKYIEMENFWAASKLLLAFSLLWFYFSWSAFIVFWYGRMPVEQNIIQLLYFGPNAVYFALSFIFAFVAPFLTLLWNSVRRTCGGPALAAGFILFGNLMDKLRVYVGTYSVPNDQINDHGLGAVPVAHYPDLVDILIVVGGISGAVFLFLWTLKRVPILSIWEMAEGIRLRVVRRFLRTEVLVLGKPD